MSNGNITVVLDTGSRNTKIGFGGEPSPRDIFPSAVGRNRYPCLSDDFPEIYFGDEAIKRRGLSLLTWPVKEMFINDWDEMEKLWYFSFYKVLHVAPEESRVMYAIHPLMPNKDKERMAEIFFESFAIKELYLAPSPALTLYSSGRTTGVVWENGFSCSYSTPVFEGFPLKNATVTSPLTGVVLTEVFNELLLRIGYSFTTDIEKDLLDLIKTEKCYVALDYEDEMINKKSFGDKVVRYHLPDGNHLILGNEIFQCTETLFQPLLQGFDCPSVVDTICSSINKCDIDYRPNFYENIVLSGGSTMIPNLDKRLDLEIRTRTKTWPEIKVNIDALPARHYAAWTGGSLLSSMTSYSDFWMTNKDFEETGPTGVNYKFF